MHIIITLLNGVSEMSAHSMCSFVCFVYFYLDYVWISTKFTNNNCSVKIRLNEC